MLTSLDLLIVRTQIVQPPADTTVLLGHTAALQCKVSSDPTVPFNIDWYREPQYVTPNPTPLVITASHVTPLHSLRRQPIKNSQRIAVKADGTLEIIEVRPSDVGQYSCIVTSPGGNETRSARLSVVELPFAPTNAKAVRLNTATHRAINVSWTPGFDGNSPVLKFIIQRREVPELGKFQHPNYPNNPTNPNTSRSPTGSASELGHRTEQRVRRFPLGPPNKPESRHRLPIPRKRSKPRRRRLSVRPEQRDQASAGR